MSSNGTAAAKANWYKMKYLRAEEREQSRESGFDLPLKDYYDLLEEKMQTENRTGDKKHIVAVAKEADNYNVTTVQTLINAIEDDLMKTSNRNSVFHDILKFKIMEDHGVYGATKDMLYAEEKREDYVPGEDYATIHLSKLAAIKSNYPSYQYPDHIIVSIPALSTQQVIAKIEQYTPEYIKKLAQDAGIQLTKKFQLDVITFQKTALRNSMTEKQKKDAEKDDIEQRIVKTQEELLQQYIEEEIEKDAEKKTKEKTKAAEKKAKKEAPKGNRHKLFAARAALAGKRKPVSSEKELKRTNSEKEHIIKKLISREEELRAKPAPEVSKKVLDNRTRLLALKNRLIEDLKHLGGTMPLGISVVSRIDREMRLQGIRAPESRVKKKHEMTAKQRMILCDIEYEQKKKAEIPAAFAAAEHKAKIEGEQTERALRKFAAARGKKWSELEYAHAKNAINGYLKRLYEEHGIREGSDEARSINRDVYFMLEGKNKKFVPYKKGMYEELNKKEFLEIVTEAVNAGILEKKGDEYFHDGKKILNKSDVINLLMKAAGVTRMVDTKAVGKTGDLDETRVQYVFGEIVSIPSLIFEDGVYQGYDLGESSSSSSSLPSVGVGSGDESSSSPPTGAAAPSEPVKKKTPVAKKDKPAEISGNRKEILEKFTKVSIEYLSDKDPTIRDIVIFLRDQIKEKTGEPLKKAEMPIVMAAIKKYKK